MERDLDFLATIADLRRRVAQLEALDASRGGLPAASRSNVRARRATTQSISPNTLTNISSDVEDVDTLGEWSTNQFTATYAGEYAVSMNGALAAIPTNRFFAYVSLTSSLTGATRQVRQDCVGEDSFSVSAVLTMAAGDSFTVGVFHQNGVALNVTANTFHVHVLRVV